MGSGDGRGPYRWASRESGRLFIASDANPSALLETAWKAGRKASRGGIPNLMCIGEPLNVLAAELGAVADRVTVILPWANLLSAVAAPDVNSLCEIAALCLPDASVEIVFSYHSQSDATDGAPLGRIKLDEQHVLTTLAPLYEQAGLRIVAAGKIPQKELLAYQTTWAKRLAFGRPREVWQIRARSLARPVAAVLPAGAQ